MIRSIIWQASAADIQDAAAIPPLGHIEAGKLATTELDRFLSLVASLDPADWSRPTACPKWDARQLLAHVVGAAAGYASWAEFARQNSPFVQRPYRRTGYSQLDALNQIQVDDRANRSPEDLIAELRRVGPRAVATRQHLPAIVRALRVPLPVLGIVRVDYLTDLIYPRDMWMHRLDLCRAAGRPMALTVDHDGRIVALVMRDLARKLRGQLAGRSVVYDLTGLAGGTWRLGRDPLPAATIHIDGLDFNLLASGRLSPEDVMQRATVDGGAEVAALALAQTTVTY